MTPNPSTPQHEIPRQFRCGLQNLTKHRPEAPAQTEPNREREPGDNQQDGEFAEVRISCAKGRRLPQLFPGFIDFSLKSLENCKYFCDAFGYIMLYPIRSDPSLERSFPHSRSSL